MRLWLSILITLISLGTSGYPPATTHAQEQLAASLLVDTATVEVQRINTDRWVEVRAESIIGEGDLIRTDASGTATIDFTFLTLEVTLPPASELEIVRFRRQNDTIDLVLRLHRGYLSQAFTATASAASYTLHLPAYSLSISAGSAQIRLEEDGRSAVLMADGSAIAQQGTEAPLREATLSGTVGIRASVDAPLSEVVPADTFPLLDAYLDGCAATLTPDGDFSYNVRLGPSVEAARVGTVDAKTVNRFFGETDDGWYRIPFGGGFGWVTGELSTVVVDEACVGLRPFTATHLEDPAVFAVVGVDSSATVIVDAANIRSGPGTSYDRIDTAINGALLIVNGRTADNEWFQIYRGNGQLGWISADLIRLNVNIEILDILPVDTVDIEDLPATATPSAEGDAE